MSQQKLRPIGILGEDGAEVALQRRRLVNVHRAPHVPGVELVRVPAVDDVRAHGARGALLKDPRQRLVEHVREPVLRVNHARQDRLWAFLKRRERAVNRGVSAAFPAFPAAAASS